MATTYDKASLVMIPSGYKDDKLYSVKPTDGSGDFTFSRDGSGASPATRVNASGLIEKGRENVLLQSNTFDTTWLNSGSITKTSGQSGYDGSSDAWRIDKGSAAAFIRQTNSQSGLRTLSVYAKAGTSDWILIVIDGSPDAFQYFDLSNGVLGATGTNITAKITRVGATDWYRCSVTGADTYTEVKIYPAEGDNNVSATSGNIYIQDAQLEKGLVATDVIETTTAPVSAGLLGDMPRLDYSGSATCPSLLLEPSRVNIHTNSEYFGASAWTKLDASITSNDTTSPEGVINASKLVESATTAPHRIYEIVNITSGQAYTQSVFVKDAGRRYFQIMFGSKLSGTDYANFDLQEGTITQEVGSLNATIEDFGNGWYRCSATATASVTSTEAFYYHLANSGTASRTPSYAGDGTSGVYIFGAMVESGSYPTSYIPTYGSASTRGADYAYNSSASGVIGQTEGAGFVEFEIDIVRDFDYDFPQMLSLSDGTESNRISLFLNDTYSTARAQLYVKNGGGVQASILSSSITAGRHKIAYAYAANDFVLYMDGVQIGTDNAGSIPTCNLVGLNGYAGASDFSEIRRQQVLLFPTRLTNAELAALTA